MDFLATPMRRRVLFAALYVSEGAPIGFLWLALPTRLKSAGVPIEQITALTAALVIPWTLKFAWAPLVDVLSNSRWTMKHWILAAQVIMGLTLTPLIWADPVRDMHWLSLLLLVHATAAATQDVAIDALCISVTSAAERGRLNGWMQAGMLAGRAAMGGGALVLSSYIGGAAVVGVLLSIIMFSAVLLLQSRAVPTSHHNGDLIPETSFAKNRLHTVWAEMKTAVSGRQTWIGLAFALTGPAAFKAFEVVIGPFLIDHGFSEREVGSFTAIVMIGAMVLGALIGGRLADRFSRRSLVASSLLFIVTSLSLLAVSDLYFDANAIPLQILIAATAFGIGVFTVAVYAMFMDLTTPTIAATQFSAFMGATNGCEAWSTLLMGRLVAGYGYPVGILTLCGVSILSLPLLLGLRRH